MRRFSQIYILWMMRLFVVLISPFVYACTPLPVLLYSPDEVYRSKGLEIPELPDNAVALVNRTSILKTDYKEWLYGKIGFDPKLRQQFILNRGLKERLQSKGIDTDLQKKIIMELFLQFESRGVIRSCAEWESENLKSEVTEDEGYRSAAELRIEKSYLQALYVLENWDGIYRLGLKDFGID